jgi:hypothetical protein
MIASKLTKPKISIQTSQTSAPPSHNLKKKEDSFNVTSVHSDEKSQPHHVKDGTQEPGAALEQINDNGQAGYIIIPHQYIERIIIKVKQADTSLTPGEEVSLTELNQANINLHFYKEEPGNLLKQKQMFHPQLNGQLLNMETNIQNARSAGVTEVKPSKLQPFLPFNINTVGIPTSPVLTTIKDDLPIKRLARQIDPYMTQH